MLDLHLQTNVDLLRDRFQSIMSKFYLLREALQNPRAEAEKPRQRVGIADRKVFVRPESFCAYNIVPKNKSKHGISFWIVWKVSR